MIDPLVRIVNLPDRPNVGKILVLRTEEPHNLDRPVPGNAHDAQQFLFSLCTIIAREKICCHCWAEAVGHLLFSLARIIHNAENTMDSSRLLVLRTPCNAHV